MDYKEVNTKGGKTIVFCNFEELLKEFYGVKTMEEVETHVDGNGEYIIHCPFCKAEGHTKHKLYIKNDLTTGHCFVCCRAYVHVSDEIDVSYRVPGVFNNFGMPPTKFELDRLKDDPEWSLDKYKYEFDDFDQKGFDYLVGRHKYMEDLYKALDFRFVDGNVVIPFKFNDEVFYYQIRFSTKSGNIRYYLPKIKNKPPYVIDKGDETKHKILIVEGVFDAIAALIQAPEFTPIAVLGSSISDYQLSYIKEYTGYVDEIKVWMDDYEKSKNIVRKIKTSINYCPISIIKSNGPDPEEVMVSRMKRGLPLQWIKSELNKNNEE